MSTKQSSGSAGEPGGAGGRYTGTPGDNRKPVPARRTGWAGRWAAVPAPAGEDRRLAERRSGLERRLPHLHYDDLTPHPRPERNINDYPLSTDEVEFINAINDYKDKFGRPFPTWSEVLHVLRTLGYIRYDTPIPPMLEGYGPFGPPPGEAGVDPAGAEAGKGPKSSA